MRKLLVGSWWLLLAAVAPAQHEAFDLMADDRHLIPLYVAKVPPQITWIRSDEQATAFGVAAWGEDKKELHVDFDHEQVLAVAWGALRFHESSCGALTEVLCEELRLDGDTVHVRVRTVIPPGPGIDVPVDSEQAGRTWYPSLFIQVPWTERLLVDVVGSRRRDAKRDFRPVAEAGFEVRIHPDESPARERIQLMPLGLATDLPRVAFERRDGEHLLEISWGKLGPGAYDLDLIAASIRNGVMHMTVRANNRRIMLYSGPGEHHPGMLLKLPPVDAVRLHVVRHGDALPAGTADFVPTQSPTLAVTVDDTRVVKR